jgi:PKD repeat protein
VSAQTVYRYLWDFGDGRTSTEKNPVHVYRMPGTYTVTLTVWDEDGNEYSTTRTDYIYVYNWEYSDASGLHVADTDLCYRCAVKTSQGVGITKFIGTNWLWPTAYTGTCRGINDAGETISLVCNNRNGRFYRVGIPEQWTDRMDSYGGYEIEGKLKLKERIAHAGEYEEIEHVESHAHIRPWKETYRNASGYSSEGFRTNHAVSLQIYENGEPTTPAAKLEEVPRYGDYVFRKRIEARRLQLEILFSTAAWRLVKVQEMIMPIDKKAGPALDRPSEETWAYEFRGADLWLSRDRLRPTMNRGTGTLMTGDYDQLTTGPDNQLRSAMAMAAAHSLTATLSNLTGDFTIMFWLGSMASFPGIIYQCVAGANTLTIQITSAGGVRSITFNDGVNGYSRQLTWTAGWVHLAVVRSGANIKIYEDGVLIYTNPMIDSSIEYGGSTIVSNGAIVAVFDVRRIARAVSADALAYYYDQVTTNGKQCPFLPIVR